MGVTLVDTKVCQKCGAHVNKAELPGKRRVCTPCKKAATALRSKVHYETYKSQIIAAQKLRRCALDQEQKEKQKSVLTIWRAKNADRVRSYWDSDAARLKRRQWYSKPEVRAKQREAMARYLERIPKDVLKRRSAEYARNNRAILNAKDSRRRALELRAVPRWANLDAVRQIYQDARELTSALGQEWQVDHIVPLNSALVCGLHVADNLQILEASANKRKSNLLWPNKP